MSRTDREVQRTLAALAQDADLLVRWRVARHPACPPEALEALARDADAGVRRAVTSRIARLTPYQRALLEVCTAHPLRRAPWMRWTGEPRG